MRDTERRKRLQRIRATAKDEVANAIFAVFDKQKKLLVRDLRRSNLRKRLSKVNPELSKAFEVNWPSWISTLVSTIKGVLTPAAEDFWTVESRYFLNRGKHIDPIDPQTVIDAYLKREGRQFEDIGEDTRNDALQKITDWYNSDKSFSTLIEDLQPYFSYDRATLIARTEVVHLSSEVSRNVMSQIGIEQFNLDITPHPGSELYPCEECVDYASQNPHSINDRMPPLHPGCDDGVTYVLAEET